MMKALLAPLIAAAMAFGTTAPAAGAGTHDVPKIFAKGIAKAKKSSGVPVLVPDTYEDDLDRLYGSTTVRKGEYFFTLAAARSCGAEACYVGSISAIKGAKPAFKQRIALAGGVRGYFKDVSCGGSCSPAFVQFKRGNVLYEVSFKSDKATLVDMANQMILTGPR